MSDKITTNDVFESDFLDKSYQAVEKITQGFKDMADQIGKVTIEQKEFLQGFKVTSAADIKKLNDELAIAQKTITELNNANKAATQGEIELAKIRQAQAKALQEEEKAQQQKLRTEKLANSEKQKTLTLYQQESKTLNDLRNRYKDLALAGRENGIVAKGLLQEITKLDAKLKNVDASVGQFQRNVGNYTSALDSFKGSVTNILGAAGIGLGLSEGISFLKESFAEFQKSEKAAKELDFALRNVGGEGTLALEKLSNQAQQLEENLGLFEAEDISNLQKQLVNLGASSTQVEKLTPKILDLAKATGMDLSSATDVAIKAINGQTKGLKEVGLEFQDTGDRTQNYNILLEKLDKFQGAAAASADTLEGKQQRLTIAWGNIKEAVGEFLTNFGTELLDFYDELTGKTSILEYTMTKIQPVFEANAKNIIKSGNAQKALNDLQERALAISKDTTLTETEKYEKLLPLERQQKAITKALDEQTLALKRNQKEFKNNKIGGGNGDGKQEDYYEKYKAEQERLRQIDAENDVVVEEKAKEHNKTLKELEEERIADELQFSAIQYEKNKKLEDEAFELKKKQREEDLKNLFDLSNKALDIAEKEIKEKDKLRQDALDKEIEQRQSNIEEQKRRAEQGLENTLAFEEKALKDAEARKEAEAQKAIKREKEITFFKLLSANAEKDPNSALQKTITEMLLGNAIAGAFFEGTEKVEDDLKGNKVHNGRDGYVVAVDGSERVLTGEQNKLIGKMSNEELAQLAYDYNNKLLPNYMISNAVNPSFSDNIYSSLQLKQMVEFTNEVKELKEIIKNRPVSSSSFDGLGNYIEQLTKNGYTTTTKKPLTRGY
jgi:hypothetical protein